MPAKDQSQQGGQPPKMSPWEAAYRAYVAAAKAYWEALDVEAIDFCHPPPQITLNPTCVPCAIFPVQGLETCQPWCCSSTLCQQTSTCTPCQITSTCTPCQIVNLNVLCLPCMASMGSLGTLGTAGGVGGGPTAPPGASRP
jgi:hypothetical protein